MAINVSVQYNDGSLPDIILLTQGYYHHRGTHLNAMKSFCICSLSNNNFIHIVESPYGLIVFLFTNYNNIVTSLVLL